MYQLQLLQREMPSLEAQLAPTVKFNLVLCAQAAHWQGVGHPTRVGHGWGWRSGCCFAGPAQLKNGAVIPMAAPKLR